ncbi:putative steroidogenic acute regulatory protein, mitochondrial-like [Apostichopus japonicus]|uniref:Putative steroidogenic acute regulatory protein, mitochondrial-like n=2 Tax=Stichopus japonicus TaxID=307972 RepID=A0A2G8JUQ2_STIJA|nr:putative steroidogenic acute regulatory protein, mitochondrial-like [Apostichopus japonicus]
MPTGCDNRDAVQCTMVRSEEDGSRHVILYKSCNHPNKPPKKSFPIRADVQLMGAIIRPKEGEEGVTTVTFVNQVNLKGWMPKAFVNKITVGFPVALYDDLTLYWKKITEPPKSPEKKEKKNKEKNGEENGEAAEEEKKEDKKEDGGEDEENKDADVKTEKKEEADEKPAEGATEEAAAAAEGAPVGEGDGGKLDTADIPAADEEEAK